MRAEKSFDRRGMWRRRRAGGDGAVEFEKFFAGADRESVGRVGDDVGVDMLAEIKADRHATRAGRFGMVVRNFRNAGEIREANDDARRRLCDVRRTSQLGRIRRWRKRAGAHDAFGVDRAEAGMEAEDGVERGEQVANERVAGSFWILRCRCHDCSPSLAARL